MEYSVLIPQIQEKLLILIDELYRVCKMHGLHPIMLGGTLLGSIRHNGFIPWDDDADFGLIRDELESLRDNQKDFGDFCYLEEFASERDNRIPWFKLRLKGTLFLEAENIGLNLPSEIFIDIIPIDNAPNSIRKQKRQQKKLRLLEALIFSRINKKVDFKHRLIKFVSYLIPVPINYLKKRYICVSKKYNSKETSFVRISSNSYRYFNDLFDKSIISSFADYSFENRTLLSFSNYDLYLKQLYGDYMTPPPENKRINAVHGVVAVNFDTSKSQNIDID